MEINRLWNILYPIAGSILGYIIYGFMFEADHVTNTGMYMFSLFGNMIFLFSFMPQGKDWILKNHRKRDYYVMKIVQLISFSMIQIQLICMYYVDKSILEANPSVLVLTPLMFIITIFFLIYWEMSYKYFVYRENPIENLSIWNKIK